jgi:hypothetical protein
VVLLLLLCPVFNGNRFVTQFSMYTSNRSETETHNKGIRYRPGTRARVWTTRTKHFSNGKGLKAHRFELAYLLRKKTKMQVPPNRDPVPFGISRRRTYVKHQGTLWRE